MTADPGARLQYRDPRMAVGQLDDVPDIEPEPVADDRQFIGKSDVDVAIGVLDQLDQFRRRRVGAKHGAAQKYAIDRLGMLGARLGHAADDAVVLDQLADHLPGQHPFRAVRNMHIELLTAALGRKAQIGAQPRQPLGEPRRRADRRG